MNAGYTYYLSYYIYPIIITYQSSIHITTKHEMLRWNLNSIYFPIKALKMHLSDGSMSHSLSMFPHRGGSDERTIYIKTGNSMCLMLGAFTRVAMKIRQSKCTGIVHSGEFIYTLCLSDKLVGRGEHSTCSIAAFKFQPPSAVSPPCSSQDG